jgi:hypothetical protein
MVSTGQQVRILAFGNVQAVGLGEQANYKNQALEYAIKYLGIEPVDKQLK